MDRIAFKVAGRRYEYDAPTEWNELSQGQFVSLMKDYGGTADLAAIVRMLGVDDAVVLSLQPADLYFLRQQFLWLEDIEPLTRLLVESVALPDGTVCHGYNADFSDVTWEEWTFADTYATAGRWDIAAAVLYRPAKADWDHESDQRIPFTKYGTEKRMGQFAALPKETLRAIEVNFLILRRHLTDRYPRLFHDRASEEKEEKVNPESKGGADWLRIIRNMMGERFFEEEKYLHLSVPSVLFQLNHLVEENNRMKLKK